MSRWRWSGGDDRGARTEAAIGGRCRVFREAKVSRAWLALGGNLGDRAANLGSALGRLGSAGVVVLRVSHAYETLPEFGADEPPYLNAVCEVETTRSPQELLAVMQAIERALGRPAGHQPGPRRCDLDLLSYDDRVIDAPDLTLPHPRLDARGFVLVPLCELDVHWRHPVSGRKAGELLGSLPLSPGDVRFFGPLVAGAAVSASPQRG